MQQEPKTIRIKQNLPVYGLKTGIDYNTRQQGNEFSGIVYIQNLKHDPLNRNSNQFVALTKQEYEIA